MKASFCFSKAFRDKIGFGGKTFVFFLLPLIFCLSACPTSAGAGVGKDTDTNPKPQGQFIPQEGKPPVKSELETISEEDVFGEYTGSISVTMDGKPYGPYTERVKIIKKPRGGVSFVSLKTVYNADMPVDIGYIFEKTVKSPDSKFTLTPEADGKLVSFTGKKATLLFYSKNDNTSRDVPSNTSISGSIYKKAGIVYISFAVQYDTEATRGEFHIKKGHETMSSVMKNGTKNRK